MTPQALSEVRKIVIHHTASSPSMPLEAIRHLHVNVNGWSGIAYSIVIDGEGRVREGRGVHVIPAANGRGNNTGTLAVCLVCDNTRTDREATPVQLATLRAVVDTLRLVCPAAEVVGHRDLKATLCPGKPVSELLAE